MLPSTVASLSSVAVLAAFTSQANLSAQAKANF
jgi:hypothetical protein